MRIKVVKFGNKWRVVFGFGVQTFHLQEEDTEESARWFAKMLRKAFKNYKDSLTPKQ